MKQPDLFYYFDTEESELLLLRRRTFHWFCAIYGVILLSGLVASISFFLTHKVIGMILIISIRVIYLFTVLGSVLLAGRGNQRTAENIIISIAFLGILTNFLYGTGSFSIVSLYSLTVSSILPIQAVLLFVRRLKYKILLNAVVLILFYFLGIYMIFRMPAESQDVASTLLFTSTFLFAMIVLPGLVGSSVRDRLDVTLVHRTLYDDVSGSRNKVMFFRDLSRILDHAHANEKRVAIYGLYLTGLNRILEKHGFHSGNLIIQQIGNRLEMLEENYSVYRISEALFAFIPKYDWNEQDSEGIVDALDQVFRSPLLLENDIISLPYRLVGTMSPDDGRSSTRLVTNLHNTALRLSGKIPNSRVVDWFDHESHQQARRLYLLENDLERMIRESEFLLQIQPKVNLSDGTIHGGEFLSRWSHPVLGTISPMEFIPLLEENGLMIDFTRAISVEAVKAFEDIYRKVTTTLVFAINMTATSLKDDSFINFILLINQKLSPYVLEVELTEDVFMEIDDVLMAGFERLKRHGIRLALDDFGTGFSNMSYLQDLNVDTIKIDRKFITPLSGNDNSIGIVKALVDMAHTFGIEVVAEGVENAEQIEILNKLGCDIAQGYFYYKPMDVGEYKAILLNSRPSSS